MKQHNLANNTFQLLQHLDRLDNSHAYQKLSFMMSYRGFRPQLHVIIWGAYRLHNEEDPLHEMRRDEHDCSHLYLMACPAVACYTTRSNIRQAHHG